MGGECEGERTKAPATYTSHRARPHWSPYRVLYCRFVLCSEFGSQRIPRIGMLEYSVDKLCITTLRPGEVRKESKGTFMQEITKAWASMGPTTAILGHIQNEDQARGSTCKRRWITRRKTPKIVGTVGTTGNRDSSLGRRTMLLSWSNFFPEFGFVGIERL